MKKQRFFTIASILIVTAMLINAKSNYHEGNEWILLGKQDVDYAIDYDVIEVDKDDVFTAIKIKVNTGSINVHKSTIHFANGDKQDMNLPVTLSKANDEGIIELNGNERIISKVGFWYDTEGESRLQGVIEVWGRK